MTNNTFTVFKDASGQYRWLSSHTNSFVDLDDEIITAAAHKEFADVLDSGEWELPPLWIAHESDWQIGQTDLFAVDEVAPGVVFVITSGVFNKGMDMVAERLMGVKSAMSHGLYVLEVGKFGDVKTIDLYRTVEISVLPDGVAAPANPRTYYVVEDKDMGIKNNVKRSKLGELLGLDVVEAIEEANKGIASKALDDDVTFKEADTEVAAVDESTNTGEDVVVDTEAGVDDVVVEDEDAEEPQYITTDEFQQFAGLLGKELREVVQTIANAMKEQNESVRTGFENVSAQVSGLQKELKRIEKERDTPSAARPAFDALLKSMSSDNGKDSGEEAIPPKEEKSRATHAHQAGAIGFVQALMEE